MTPTLPALDPTIFPADVLAFAAERGVTDYLTPIYELAKDCFPGADVGVTFERDYEEPGLSWIVIGVAINHWPEDARQAARRKWGDEFLRTTPPAAREAFALGRR